MDSIFPRTWLRACESADGCDYSSYPCVSEKEFEVLLEEIGGFEPSPRLAVAVSGGVDSMALLRLCHEWTRARNGLVIALTVNHYLRHESTQEVQKIKQWLMALGIEHTVLVWEGPKPTTAVQEIARKERYRLLIEACKQRRILHLLLGHQREDQAETLLQRLAKGSGMIGLAAMTCIQERDVVRVIRPLLSIPKQRLKATCRVANQRWLEDPSNYSEKFARGRVRQIAQTLSGVGYSSANLARSARRLGRTRAEWEMSMASLSAKIISIYPEGYLSLKIEELMTISSEMALFVLERCCSVIGRCLYPPRRHKLERLYRALQEARKKQDSFSYTLAGCRILGQKRHSIFFIARESGDITDVRTLRDGQTIWWDQRFMISLIAGHTDRSFTVTRFKPHSYRLSEYDVRLPREVMETLPALWSQDRLISVAYLKPNTLLSLFVPECDLMSDISFVPKYSLTPATFVIAPSLESSYLKNKVHV